MSNKSLLTEFKWQLKKQAYQLGTPSLDIPTGDVAGDAPAGSYGEALSAAAQHRSAMQRELDRYRRDYGYGGRYSGHIDPKEFTRGLEERQFALRNAARALPMAATDLARARAAKQGLRPGIFGRVFRSIGAGIRGLLPATPRIGRVV
jgi:hypothetical protein